ncbi:hypothetical protein IEQ34_007940 [Dendrobium chrysotoxum]|uniref:Uncharacterized protein n=1 Tax=Dendrobium chrysotoxum TaxID=161865 RepID=A0AAV7H6Z2_DENCH|nr:hypothetical protein IEQ34_007940 [Dendrobium chrysotoxum]
MEEMLKKLLEVKTNPTTSKAREHVGGSGSGGNPNIFRGRENPEVEILEGEDGIPPLESLSREEMSIGYARKDQRVDEEMMPEMEEQTESSLASSSHDKDETQKDVDLQKMSADDRLSGTHADKMSTEESGSDLVDVQKVGRPMSPGTLALMCDEQDMLFMSSEDPNPPSRLPYNQSVTEVYAEQEKCVLMAYRESLLKLINCGTAKEAKFSSMSLKADKCSHQEPVNNSMGRVASSGAMQLSEIVNAFPAFSNSNVPSRVGNQTIQNGLLKPKIENIEM